MRICFPGHCFSLKIAHRSSFIRLHRRFVSRGPLFSNFLVSINMIMLSACSLRWSCWTARWTTVDWTFLVLSFKHYYLQHRSKGQRQRFIHCTGLIILRVFAKHDLDLPARRSTDISITGSPPFCKVGDLGGDCFH